MPRCRDGSWCIDDLCHMTEKTLCGLDTLVDLDANGERLTEDDQDDDPYWAEDMSD